MRGKNAEAGLVDGEAAVPETVVIEPVLLVPEPGVDERLGPLVLGPVPFGIERAAEHRGDLRQAPGVQGVERVQVDAVHGQRPGLFVERDVVPVRQVVLAGFPAGPHPSRGGLFPGRDVLADRSRVRSPLEQPVVVAVAAGQAARPRRRPEVVPALEVRVGLPQQFEVAQPLEELQDDERADRRLGPVGRPARAAAPVRDIAVGVLRLEEGPEGVRGQLLAFERQAERSQERAAGEERPIVLAAVRPGKDPGPSGRRIEPVAARLVEDVPIQAVGDGLGNPRVQAAGFDPLLFVDLGLVVEERADGLGVPVAKETVGHAAVRVADACGEGEHAVRARSVGAGQAAGRPGSGFAGPARPDAVGLARGAAGAAPDLAVVEERVLALETPGKIVEEGDPDVGGVDDPADDRLLVPARPFDREGLTPRRGLHQDGRRAAELERQTQVEAHPGIQTVRGMGADLGDEVIEIGALGGLPFPLDPEDEGEGGVRRRGDDQPRPAGRVQRPDEGVLPRIEDLAAERDRRGEEKAEGEYRSLGHSGNPWAAAHWRLLYGKKSAKSRQRECFSAVSVIKCFLLIPVEGRMDFRLYFRSRQGELVHLLKQLVDARIADPGQESGRRLRGLRGAGIQEGRLQGHRSAAEGRRRPDRGRVRAGPGQGRRRRDPRPDPRRHRLAGRQDRPDAVLSFRGTGSTGRACWT